MVNNKSAALIGEKLKKTRIERGLSLEDLAQKTQLTRSFLSQIENSKTSPSINSLVSIAHALGINVGDFFREVEENREHFVIHQRDRVAFSIERNHLTVELLAPRKQGRKFDPMFMRFGVGGDSGTIQGTESFFLVILEGELELNVGGEIYLLTTGDSIYLDGSREARGRNIGSTDVTAFAVASTPIV